MNEPSKRQNPAEQYEAIDVSDFVYAATGARVRRLTMPDGSHWFPAVDVCKELGHTNSRQALADHVPDEHREILETVTGAYGLSIPAGRQWRRDLNIISLRGLILLVNACTKPACAPFKQWAAEVIETVQREGHYTLTEAEVQPAEPGAPIAYAMPEQVAEAIVRLEAHNLRLDEELVGGQRESIALHREMLATQQATLAVQQAMVRAMERIADRFDTLVLERRTSHGHLTALPTTESVLADWRQRLSRDRGRVGGGRGNRPGARREGGTARATGVDRRPYRDFRAPCQRMPPAAAQARLHSLAGRVRERRSGVRAPSGLSPGAAGGASQLQLAAPLL